MPLPEYLIYRKVSKYSKIEIRKLRTKEVGICVGQTNYDFPFSTSAETFINKDDAIKLIKSLKEYFGIEE